MTHKLHPGLESWWRMKITRKHYIEVFLWENKDAMYAANDFNRGIEFRGQYAPQQNHNFLGQATAGIQAIRIRGNKESRKLPRKFGEIFLVSNKFGVGVVSHEIAHILNYWIDAKHWSREVHDERIARITGDLNACFWVQFYKRYKDAKPG